MKKTHLLVIGTISAILMVFVGCGKKSKDDDPAPAVVAQQKLEPKPCSTPQKGSPNQASPCATSTPAPIPTPTMTPLPLPTPYATLTYTYVPGSETSGSNMSSSHQSCQEQCRSTQGFSCYFNCRRPEHSNPCSNSSDSSCVSPFAPFGSPSSNMPLPPNGMVDDECGDPESICFSPSNRFSGIGIQLPRRGLIESLFERRDLENCLSAMEDQGISPQGSWPLQVTEMRTISAFGHNVFYETSSGPRVVLVKANSAIGSTDIILGNPQALYCVKYTSILEDVRIGSCWANNVVILKGVDILSNISILPLICQ